MIADRLKEIRDRMAEAASRNGRSIDSVKLIAVSKGQPSTAIREAYEAGQCDFGENYLQEAAVKMNELRDCEIVWHAVGHVQSNKIKIVLNDYDYWHSLGSLKLLNKVASWRETSATPLPKILVQVNLGNEESKSGVSVEALDELVETASRLGVPLCGLMALPPLTHNVKESERYFGKLVGLARVINDRRLNGVRMDELSMGMSDDFEIAVGFGATMIRVGQAIFGPRH